MALVDERVHRGGDDPILVSSCIGCFHQSECGRCTSGGVRWLEVVSILRIEGGLTIERTMDEPYLHSICFIIYILITHIGFNLSDVKCHIQKPEKPGFKKHTNYNNNTSAAN